MNTQKNNVTILVCLLGVICSLLMCILVPSAVNIANAEKIILNETEIPRENLHNRTNNITNVESEPSITIFTNGLTSDASIWFEDGYYNKNLKPTFYFQNGLIDSFMNRTAFANLVLVNEIRKNGDNFNFVTTKLTLDKYDKPYLTEELTELSKETFDNHLFLLFESVGNEKTFAEKYAELHYVIDTFINDYQKAGRQNLKINLVGHGSGGLLNLKYATEHKNNVASMFSIGTPFNGIDTAALIQSMVGGKFDIQNILDAIGKIIDQSGENKIDLNSQAYRDLNDIKLLTELRDNWNAIQSTSNIKSHAIGSAFDIEFAEDFVASLYNITDLVQVLQGIINPNDQSITYEEFLKVIHKNYDLVSKLMPASKDYLFLLSFIKEVRETKNIYEVFELIFDYKYEIANILDKNSAEIFIENLNKNKLVLMFGKAMYPNHKDLINEKLANSILKDYDADIIYGNNSEPLIKNNTLIKLIKNIDSDGTIIGKINETLKSLNTSLSMENFLGSDEIDVKKLFSVFNFNSDGINVSVKDLMPALDKISELLNEIKKSPIGWELLRDIFLTFINVGNPGIVNQFLPFIQLKSNTPFGDGVNIFEDNFVVLSDGYISLNSQIAENYDGITRYQVLNSKEYVYTVTNSFFPLPIPHNMQINNSEIINYIRQNININFVEPTDFDVRKVNEDFVEIVRIGNKGGENIIIPERIYGKKVVGIGSNAFANSKFLNISLPESIMYIGEGAFANSALLNITIPKYCEFIGQDAFINCSDLQFNVNAENTYFSVENNLLLNYDKSVLICCGISTNSNVLLPNSVKIIAQNAFYNVKNINSINLSNVEIIERSAFKGSSISQFLNAENLKSVAIDSFIDTPWLNEQNGNALITIGKVLVRYNGGENVVINNSSIEVIGSGAFVGSDHITSVELYGIKSINELAFAYCKNLKTVKISDEIIYICARAFENVSDLTVDIRKSTVPIIYSDAFNHCGDNLRILVPSTAKENYLADGSLAMYTENIESITSKISFISNNSQTFEPIIQEYCSVLSKLPTPSKTGYTFDGWYLNNKKFQNGALWNIDCDSILSAKWTPITYALQYVCNGGSSISNPLTYTIESTFTLIEPTRTGYIFGGWYGKADYSGAAITQIKNCTGNKTLYAKWTPNAYIVTLNKNASDAQVVSTSATVIFDKTFNLPIPIRQGYNFIGWFDSALNSSHQYTNSNGASLATWRDVVNKTFVAHWSPYKYVIKVNADNGGAYLSINGVKSNKDKVNYQDPVSIYNAINNYFNSQNKTGYIYNGFTNSKNLNLVNSDTIPYIGVDGTQLDVTPQWLKERFTINCMDNNIKLQTITAYYMDTIRINKPTKAGYIFQGWKISGSDCNVSGTVYEINKTFNGDTVKMPDLSPKEGKNGVLNIKAVWRKKFVNFILDSYGGNKTIKINYGDKVSGLPVPKRNGYTFRGWFDKNVQISNNSIWKTDYEGNLSLISHWELINYSIQYNLNGGINASNPENYNISTATIVLKNPSKIGYYFNRWKDASNKTITSINKGSIGNKVLIAEWLGKEVNSKAQSTTISDPYLIINFSDAVANDKKEYSIMASVKELTLKNHIDQIYDQILLMRSFKILNRTSDLKIRLWNCEFSAFDNKSAITGVGNFTLTLESIGKYNRIDGGKLIATESKPTIQLENRLIIKGNAPLSIRGKTQTVFSNRNGNVISIHYDDSGFGLNGGVAVKVNRLDIYSSVEIIGGNGSLGKNGNNGKSGANGANGSANINKSIASGKAGGKGGNGSIGGSGGNGGYAVDAGCVAVSGNGYLISIGGNGGCGGTGGNGGHGGNGGRGADAQVFKYSGVGGNGGNGGDGGNGGKGGSGSTAIRAANINGNIDYVTGKNGSQGYGGFGGIGGIGGQGGKQLNGSYRASGSNGQFGKDGTPVQKPFIPIKPSNPTPSNPVILL